MKNRILRSALSVALCAAMLLSQGLTAFAEGEIDLAAAKSSPVQESSEELVPGASDLKPEIKNVVLPQRAARSAAPEIETYSIPDSSGYTEILGYQALVDDCELHVYINGTDSQNPSGNIELTDSNDVETTFPQGTGFRIFEASPSENWIFDEWQTHIYLKKLIDENTIDSENHSSAGKTAFEPSGNSILVNRLAALGETIVNKVYYSVYANFNPTVSVTVNGASQDEAVFIYPNNKVENTGRYEVDYGDEIIITAKDGYEITAVTVDGEGIESVGGTSYTLTDVIKPHDIVVTVEKTGGEPEISEPTPEQLGDLIGDIGVCCKSYSAHETRWYPIRALTRNSDYTISLNPVEKTCSVTLSVDALCSRFNDNFNSTHTPCQEDVTIRLIWADGKWSLAEEITPPVMIDTTCAPDTPMLPDLSKIEELLGTMAVTCVNPNHNVTETYDITWDSIGGLDKAPTANGNGTYSLEITVSHNTYLTLFNQTYPNHKWATDDDMENEKVTLIWKNGEWIVEGETNFAFKVECHTPSTGSLWGWNNGKEVIITCVEENALHTKGLTLSLTGVNGNGYWKFAPITWDQEQECYATTVTLEPGKYLDVYSGQYGVHALVNDHEDTVLSLDLYYQDRKWISSGDKFYLFVECNAPSKPTIDDLDRLFNNNTKVNISCEKNKHADKWYPVKDEAVNYLDYLFIGPVEVDANNHYTAKISLNDAFFVNLYNQEEGGDHSLVSKTYITLSYDGEKWVFDDESTIDFDVVVTCPDNDNPGGGDNPGTNPGGDNNPGGSSSDDDKNNNGGHSVSRPSHDRDDDWEPLPNNNYRVTKKNDKPSQNTQIVVRDPADNSDNTSSNTGSDSGKHNPETGDTTTAFAAMALAAVSLGGVVLLGRKKK